MVFMAVLLPIGQRWIIKAAALRSMLAARGCCESTRAATRRRQRPPQLAANCSTLHGPDRFRLPTERGSGAKYEVGLLVWVHEVGFMLRGNLPLAQESF